MRGRARLQTLRARRVILCDKFARKALANPRFQHWFPYKNQRTSLRAGKTVVTFREERARCSTFDFCRRLNGKAGKIYGKRR